ncbi:MAG: hypothetical protein AAFP19_13085 [Bacteroidota bacterium]
MIKRIPSPSFLLAAGLLFFINLLLTNDFTTVWNDTEALYLLEVQTGKWLGHWPGWIHGLIEQLLGFQIFALRLPGLLLWVLSLGLAYFVGRKVFGGLALQRWALLLFCSLLIVNIAKVATLDIWLLSAQLLNFIFLIRGLKQPHWTWQTGYWSTLLLGLLVAPLAMLLWTFLLTIGLYYWHPRKLDQTWVYGCLPIVLLAGIGWGMDFLNWDGRGLILGQGFHGYGLYLLAVVLGLVPILGFLPAAIWDTVQKFRKGEELAIILTVSGIAALLSQSLMLEMILLLAIARQIAAFNLPNYPYKGSAQVFSFIVLIAVFCVACVMMLSGFQQLGAAGFRSAMSIAAIYWVLGLIGVIGLFIKSDRVIWIGFVWSGLLLTALFWIQINPFVEEARNLPRQISQYGQSLPDAPNTWLLVDTTKGAVRANLQLYAFQLLIHGKDF